MEMMTVKELFSRYDPRYYNDIVWIGEEMTVREAIERFGDREIHDWTVTSKESNDHCGLDIYLISEDVE